MAVRFKVKCPLCRMSHYHNGNSVRPVDLPEIVAVKVTNDARGRLVNNMTPIEELQDVGGDDIEREILEDMKRQVDTLSGLLEMRLAEL